MKFVKHGNGKNCIAAKEKWERDITQMQQKCDCEVHPVGENLPEQVRIELKWYLHS